MTDTPLLCSRGGDSRPVRVLIADDSALMRQALRRVLTTDPAIEVVDAAYDGLDMLLKVERLQPDVVTLDVEMPRLDGLSALGLLMERFPRPVVMLSSLTDAGTEATVRALALGAVDFQLKPASQTAGGLAAIAEELIAKVKRAAQMRVRPRRLPLAPLAAPTLAPASDVPRATPLPAASAPPARLLVVGASTGGPRALAELLAALPGDLPAAAIVVQHLPAGFTRSLAQRLDQGSPLAVAEAHDGDALTAGRVLVAPGDHHLQVTRRRVLLDRGPRRHGVRPAIDPTLESAAAHFGPAVLAVILTGMGHDGTEGARAVKAAGGHVLAEAEASCVVYGMPRAVVEAGLADAVVPLPELPAAIVHHLSALAEHSASPRGEGALARRAMHV
jgi:two-component system chemotaxis response regulator CheB